MCRLVIRSIYEESRQFTLHFCVCICMISFLKGKFGFKFSISVENFRLRFIFIEIILYPIFMVIFVLRWNLLGIPFVLKCLSNKLSIILFHLHCITNRMTKTDTNLTYYRTVFLYHIPCVIFVPSNIAFKIKTSVIFAYYVYHEFIDTCLLHIRIQCSTY